MLTNKQRKLNDFVIREAGLELDDNNHVIDQYTGYPIVIKDKMVKYNNTNISRLSSNEIEFDPLNNPLLASEICNTYITNLQNEEELNVISYGISNKERNTAGRAVCISDEKIYTREYNLDTLKYIDLIATINNTPTDSKESIVLKSYDAKQPANPTKRRRK